MPAIADATIPTPAPTAEDLFVRQLQDTYVRTDRLFAVLMIVQWVAGIVFALTISPKVWTGRYSAVHPHVWAALVLGGAISAFPLVLIKTRPGHALTRHVIAVAQMLWSALLIHLTGGRIETHFHVFGSLAFLAFYRDWRVLVTATVVVAGDHLLRGIVFPQSVYGVLTASPWRSVEHAAWVVFEDVILSLSCLRGVGEMRAIAEREARLMQSEERLGLLVKELHFQKTLLESQSESSIDGILAVSREGRIVSHNRRFLDMWGLTEADVADRSDAAALRSVQDKLADPREFFARVAHLYEQPELTSSDEIALRDGRTFDRYSAPIRGRDGTNYGRVWFFRDITRRKQDEAALRLATCEARAANRAKSEFLANMSHEIRSPMTAIVGYAEMMLEPEQTLSDRQDCLQIIRRNARHLLELIGDILDLSKIEADRMTVERIDCDPARIVVDVVSLMRPRSLEKGLSFECSFVGAIPERIRSDALRLKQILMNLVGNAIKFTHKGGVYVQVACDTAADGNFIRIDVTDTGIGLTPEQQAGLFQPFAQADKSTTRRFGGTGLGLVISQRLAGLLGGEVTLRSQLNVGSTFSLRIDAGPLEGVPMRMNLNESMLAPPVQPVGNAPVTLQGRILFAEDGLDNQKLVCMHLNKAGAEVVVAENGRVALDLALSQPFDLILMDMQMPELDGYGATSELRRRGFTKPIVALTAHAMTGDRERCLQAGCTDYLAKPIERDLLLRTVAQHLNPAGTSANPITSRFENDQEMREILAEFVGRLPEQVARVTALLRDRQLESLRREIHQLKGAGGGYGFGAISELAARAEAGLKAQVALDAVARDVDELVALIRRVKGYDPAREGRHA